MRNTNISSMLFSVEPKKLGYIDYEKQGSPQFIPIPGARALVDVSTGRSVGIVGQGYQLVTNEKAIEYGKKCVSQLLPSVNTDNIEIFNIITPSTRSWCHIDLIYKGYEINFGKQEIYLPYIRVTNSYNTSRALKFEIGFCRKICDNGVIFESVTIKFYFAHTKDKIGRDIEFSVKEDEFKSLEAVFIGYLTKVADTKIDKTYVLPLVCKALQLTFDIEARNGKRQALEIKRLQIFQKEIMGLTNKYFEELGDNAYAVFAVLTDYASNYDENDKRKILKINGFQKRAGQWLESFLNAYNSKDFDWEAYLSPYLRYAQ